MKLTSLDDYTLINIFEFCSETDLENLCKVCNRFNDVIETYIYYVKSFDLLLTGHRGNTGHYQRTFNKLSYMKHLKINDNWRKGRFEESIYFDHHILYASLIHLEKTLFYMTHGGQIRVHRRQKKDFLKKTPVKYIGKLRDPDITSFAKKSDTIFAGCINGWSFVYENEQRMEQKTHSTKEYINCVDFHKDTFITASNVTSKLWRKETEFGLVLLELAKDINESFKCVKMNEHGTKIAAGKYRDKNGALFLIDTETGTLQKLNSRTSAVYDTLWKDDFCILTANFDTTFRVYDTRTSRDEQIYEDPYDSSIYCLDYDGLYGVLCGMKYHGRVNLYDLRVPRKFIQMYFPSQIRNRGSPVYSIASDASQLFIVTDHNLRLFNFDTNWAGCKDYSNVFIND